MKIKNKLNYIFGDTGRVIGILIFIVGILISFYSWVGITTFIVGGFLAFTHTATKVDFYTKTITYLSYFFGFIPYGYKLNISDSMEFSILKNDNKFTVVLKNGEIVVSEIKHFFKEEEAQKFLNELNSNFLTK
ncbi:MAG: hypothetical protein SNJ64_05995 [Endomicrobiia bacterium]